MGFLSDLGRGAAGWATGGLSEIARLLGTDPTTVTQEPLRTPEQLAAQKKLLDFGNTGVLGDYTAGTPYSGSFGDFNLSDLEKLSQSNLTNLLTSGMPASFTQGQNALSDLLTTEKYNPLQSGGAYDLMTGTLDRQIRDATTAAKRDAAYTGNLYSSDAIRKLGDVQAKGQEAKGSLLGSLYQNYIQQKLGAIPQAFNAAQVGEGINLNRINAGYTAGALPRNLATAKDQATYQDFVRRQSEKGGQLSAISNLANANAPYGTPSLTLPGTSGWETLLNLGAKIAPYALMAGA